MKIHWLSALSNCTKNKTILATCLRADCRLTKVTYETGCVYVKAVFWLATQNREPTRLGVSYCCLPDRFISLFPAR